MKHILRSRAARFLLGVAVVAFSIGITKLLLQPSPDEPAPSGGAVGYDEMYPKETEAAFEWRVRQAASAAGR